LIFEIKSNIFRLFSFFKCAISSSPILHDSGLQLLIFLLLLKNAFDFYIFLLLICFNHFCAKKKFNVHRWPFISNYFDVSFDVSRPIPKVYPLCKDFLSCFSPIICDLSCFIRSNLYYPMCTDSVG
jgi:hypothetical protein